jgi:predicted phage terminase large subunit-like protein
VGATAGVHGRGAHVLLLDDLYGSLDDVLSPAYRESVWRIYTSSLHTRLTPGGAVVALGTPFHHDDWFGRTRRAESDGGDRFDWVKLPAFARPDDPLGRALDEPLWPEGGWTAEALTAKRDQMRAGGNYRDWRAQYDLEPVSGDGVSEWPDDYFRHLFDPYAVQGEPWTSVLAIDTSKGSTRAARKGDYQAFAYVEPDGKGHTTATCELHRLDVEGLLAKALELIRRHRPRYVVVETNGAGYVLYEALKKLPGRDYGVLGRAHTSSENKTLRIQQRLGAALHAGVLHFPATPHNRLVVDQLRLFPHAEYDDGPDALEMALELVAQLRLPKADRRVQYAA